MINKEIIIVGAGISGVVIGRILAEKGYHISIYEKRKHIGGNMYDYQKDGVLIHKYGPHIFHTSNEEVFQFMSRFWTLNDFRNIVEGYVKDKLVPIPFNFKSIDLSFPEQTEEIKKKLLELFPNKSSIPILDLMKSNDPLINNVAQYIYQNLFLNYTTKMWNLKPDEIDSSVTARIPIILSYNNTYFNDKYEGLPIEGYTKTFEKMIDHKNIKLFLSNDANQLIDFENDQIIFDGKKNIIMVYTGPIDLLFKQQFGILDYRSLFFAFETHHVNSYQKTAVVNYPADPTMTRITEYKNMTKQVKDGITVIGKEYPGQYNINDEKFNEPYYPLATQEARRKYEKYFDYAKKYKNLFLCGRLAQYKYINMDQAIDQAMKMAQEILKNEGK